MSQDIDDNMPIVQRRPQDKLRGKTAGSKRKHPESHQCYLCESLWPDNLEWPPPKRKVKKRVLVTVIQEPEDQDSQVPDRSRLKKRRVVNDTSTVEKASDQLDSLDRGLPSKGRTVEDRRTSATETFQMFLNRNDDIPNFLEQFRNAVTNKESELAELENQRREEEAEQQRQRAAREAERVARAAAETLRKTAEREDRARQ